MSRFTQALHQMAYPVAFSFNELEAQRSYAAKLRYCETHLQKLGSGSSRAVYRVDDEKVLKVAKNAKGLAQNQAESDWGLQNYSITAKTFDRDEDGIFIEMELARPARKSDFGPITGVPYDQFLRFLELESDRKDRTSTFGKPSPEDKELSERLWENEFIQDFMYLVSDYGYPLPGDFARVSTWGVVQREGSPSLVLIDFGLTGGVAGEHYSRKKKAAGRW